PMHPKIVPDKAESCPICGMDLVLKKIESASLDKTDNQYPAVEVPASVVHNLAVRTVIVKRGELKRNIETIGKITRVDPMARRTITPPIRGELLYIAEKYQGDMVEPGELLFTITSDKLVEMQNTYQTAFLDGDRATATAMIPELRKMGLTPEQIGELQNKKEPTPVEVHAFEEGFVYTRRGKVGESVHTGFTVFNVGGNYQVIEVTAEIFERQWSWVEQGQEATMTVRGLPGVSFTGKVVRVEPPVGYTTRSLEVALKFRTDNSELSQSMFAHISISGNSRKNVLLVPTDTVIKTGKGDRVILASGNNQFQPVEVVAGEESDGWTEIRKGLEVGEKVVASGQFLIDSESNLQAGLNRMKTPGVQDAEYKVERHQPDTPPSGKVSDDDGSSLDIVEKRSQQVSLLPAVDPPDEIYLEH
ncbi:MAG: efflux RND transporter periplasmic adaptor subunit, partial [Gammaproteobacteria bacterium]|nr:efflux RND transporter periplasmic adaptor subunit [Gammaproteobacteria bacterium]